MIQQSDNHEATDKAILLNEKGKTERSYRTTSLNGTTVKSKWIFEIFHGDTVYGIHQIEINESENRSKFIGTPQGKAVRIELMNDEQVEKVTFEGMY